MRRHLLPLFAFALLVGSVQRSQAESNTQQVVLAVSGMHCESCATGITAMLKRTDGVLDGKVSYETRKAVVDYDASKTSPERIVAVIEKMGYKAAIKK